MKLAKAPFGRLKITASFAEPLFFSELIQGDIKTTEEVFGSNQSLYCQVKEATLIQDYTFFRKLTI